MKPFVKIVSPGKIKLLGKLRELFIKIEYCDGDILLSSGVVDPWHSGNCGGSCGQCDEELEKIAVSHEGWDKAPAKKFRQVWNDRHLNHMRPGCVIQEDWKTHEYLKLPEAKKHLAWV